MKRITTLTLALLGAAPFITAQNVLSLEECREMAVKSNRDLSRARLEVEMSDIDRKIARANYFPNVSALGTYLYNSRNISLIDDGMSDVLTNAGTTVQTKLSSVLQSVMTDPGCLAEISGSPMWQTLLTQLKSADVSTAINALGAEIDDAFHLDMENVWVGGVSVQQPLFMGGKIVAANRIAELARGLSRSKYDLQWQEVVLAVDQAYWQIVSIANKKELARSYADLLHNMVRNVEIAVEEGASTRADALAVKVKANEADMLLTKSTNGLVLARMLLCKEVGLPLDSDITLADEKSGSIPEPVFTGSKSMEEIIAERPETRSLDLACQIYDRKVALARADMLPRIALTGNYVVSNPCMFNGWNKEFGGFFNAGVVVTIPIFHGTEALQKARKARLEARIYEEKYNDACEMIELEVEQLRLNRSEISRKIGMASSNLDNAEENLRMATIGFEEGVVDATTALAAHTAWLQANSECIDAGIELQINNSQTNKAEANE